MNKEKREIWDEINEIKISIGKIETKLNSSHICKYNGKVGELVEFKDQSGEIRRNIFNRLDRHDDEIAELKKIQTELQLGTEYLKSIKDEQKKWLMGIAASVLIFFLLWFYKAVLLGLPI